jgi:hypothetical protein
MGGLAAINDLSTGFRALLDSSQRLPGRPEIEALSESVNAQQALAIKLRNERGRIFEAQQQQLSALHQLWTSAQLFNSKANDANFAAELERLEAYKQAQQHAMEQKALIIRRLDETTRTQAEKDLELEEMRRTLKHRLLAQQLAQELEREELRTQTLQELPLCQRK